MQWFEVGKQKVNRNAELIYTLVMVWKFTYTTSGMHELTQSLYSFSETELVYLMSFQSQGLRA